MSATLSASRISWPAASSRRSAWRKSRSNSQSANSVAHSCTRAMRNTRTEATSSHAHSGRSVHSWTVLSSSWMRKAGMLRMSPSMVARRRGTQTLTTVGRRAGPEQAVRERGLLPKFRDHIGRKADEAAPDDPADALVVAGAEVRAAADQNRERGRADGGPNQRGDSHEEFAAVAEQASETCKLDSQERGGERGEGAFDETPATHRSVDRHS